MQNSETVVRATPHPVVYVIIALSLVIVCACIGMSIYSWSPRWNTAFIGIIVGTIWVTAFAIVQLISIPRFLTKNHTTNTVTITYIGGWKQAFRPDHACRVLERRNFQDVYVHFRDPRSQITFRPIDWPKETGEALLNEMREAAAAFEQRNIG